MASTPPNRGSATRSSGAFNAALPPGQYGIQTQAYSSTGGKSEISTWLTFTVIAPDTTPAQVSLAKPAKGQVLPAGSPVVVSGSATDDRGVQTVGVAIKRISDALWLPPDGTWGKCIQQSATLSNPDAADTGFTCTVDLPVGEYGLQVRATDTSGNKGDLAPWLTFKVEVPDTEKPSLEVVLPSAGQKLDAGPLWLVGTAADIIGVAGVEVSIKRADGL